MECFGQVCKAVSGTEQVVSTQWSAVGSQLVGGIGGIHCFDVRECLSQDSFKREHLIWGNAGDGYHATVVFNFVLLIHCFEENVLSIFSTAKAKVNEADR